MLDYTGNLRVQTPADYAALVESHFNAADSDGIVVLPLSTARVEAAIAASGRSGDGIVGRFGAGPAFTVRQLAELAMMAGCEPRYMPLIATVFGILTERTFPSSLFISNPKGYFPYVVINGPIRHEINVNCRPNVFGPGFRANATIGRTIHLGLVRFGGADPARSTLGNAYKFACVIGEDEEHSPWPAFSAESGFTSSDSVVTVLVGTQTKVLSHQLSTRPEHLLSTFAEELSTVTQFDRLDSAAGEAAVAPKGVLVLAEDHRGYIRDSGWNRAMMQEYVHSVARRRVGDVRAAGYANDSRLAGKADDEWVSVCRSPADFLILSAGSGGGRSMIGSALCAVTRKVAAGTSRRMEPAERVDLPTAFDQCVSAVERLMTQDSTDGWPVIPPDSDGVAKFVAASGREQSDSLGVAPWRAGPVTVRDLAINALMAGCRPEYMPLLCTIYELLFEPGAPGLGGMAPSTMGYNAWYIVHGPIARQLELNCGGGLLGPGARANVAIGRAIRLGMMNLAALRPDRVDRSCLGQAFKYGAVIAEDEAASPWEPLHSTFGVDARTSAVTMSWGAHPRITYNSETRDPRALLTSIAEDLSTIANLDSPSARGPAGGTAGTTMADPGAFMRERGRLVVMGGGHRKILEAAGWSRRQVQEFLWQCCQRTVADARAKGFETSPFIRAEQKDEELVRLVTSPEKFHIVFAGGPGGVTISVSSIATTRPVRSGT